MVKKNAHSGREAGVFGVDTFLGYPNFYLECVSEFRIS